jgi:hypothetical protein
LFNFQPLALSAQPEELFTLVGRQDVGTAIRIDVVLLKPVGYGLSRDLELARDRIRALA